MRSTQNCVTFDRWIIKIHFLLSFLLINIHQIYANPNAQNPNPPTSTPTPTPKTYRWFAVPAFSYDTDDGLGVGARTELALDRKDYKPYHKAFVIHIFASNRGFHHHRFNYDQVGIGYQKRFRFTSWLAWRQWKNDNYYGIGNQTLRILEPDHIKYYKYQLIQPFSYFTLRFKITDHLQIGSFLNLKYNQVKLYENSLLEADQPFGIGKGLSTSFGFSLIYDQRSPEITPEKGFWAEISIRHQPELNQKTGTFSGVFSSFRYYLSLNHNLVWATRLMGEYLWGHIPFYEMVHWGGVEPIAGFGGSQTLRGIKFGRWRGPGKAILNQEFRWDVIKSTLFGASAHWQLAPFFDLGLVYAQPEQSIQKANIPRNKAVLHPSFGLGFRLVYDQVFIGRIDVGLGYDPGYDQKQNLVNAWNFGAYVVFGHCF